MMFSSDDYELPIEEGVEIPVVDVDRPPPSDSSPVGSGSRLLGTSSGNAGGSRRLGRFRSFGRGAAAGAAPGPMAARIPAIPTDFEQEDRAVRFDDDGEEEEECPTTGPGPTSKGRVTKRTLVLVVGVALALAGGAMMGIAAHQATTVSAANAYADAGPTLEECRAWQLENGGTSGGKSGKAGSGDVEVDGKSGKATSDEMGGGSKSGKGSKASGDGMSYDSTDAWEEVYDKMEVDRKVSNDGAKVGFVRRNRKHLRRELGKVAAWEDPTYVSRPSAKSSKATVPTAKSGKGAKDSDCSEDDYYPRRELAKEPPAYMDRPSSMRYEFVEHMQSKSSKASSPGASKSGKSGSSKGSKGCDAASGDGASSKSSKSEGDSHFVEQCKALLKAHGNEKASKSAKGSGDGEGKSGKGSLSYDYFEYSKSGKSSAGGDSGAKAEKSRTLRH